MLSNLIYFLFWPLIVKVAGTKNRCLAMLLLFAFPLVAQDAGNTSELQARYDVAIEKGQEDLAASLALTLGEAYNSSGQTEQASVFFKKAAELSKANNDFITGAKSFTRLGDMNFQKGEFVIAVNHYSTAAKVYRNQLSDKEKYSEVLLKIGQSLLKANQYQQAVTALERLVNLTSETNQEALKIEGYGLLSEAYEKLGNKEKASSYYKSYQNTLAQNDEAKNLAQKDAYIAEIENRIQATNRKLSEQEALVKSKEEALESAEAERREIEALSRQRETEIRLLNAEKELREVELVQKESQIANEKLLRNIALGGIAFFLVVLALLLRANQLRRRQNRLLAAKNREVMRQKEEIEAQRNQVQAINKALEQKQAEIMAQNERIDRINTSLEKANREITLQKEVVERQKAEVERSYENIRMLTKVGQEITATLDIKYLLTICHLNLVRFMDVSVMGIGLPNEDGSSLNFKGVTHKGKWLPDYEESFAEKDSPAVQCFQTQKQIVIQDLKISKSFVPDKKYYQTAAEVPNSLFFVPITVADRAIGVFTVQHYERQIYNKYHLSILDNLTSYIAVALQNANTYQQLSAAKKTIENKNRSMLDSIRYAQKIQGAVLPEKTIISKIFPNTFIFYRPKDIVSGDFYWYAHHGKTTFLAVADCTGHGVPGAFMSMIGSILFDEIINQKKITDPGTILGEMHLSVRTALNQNEQDKLNQDGMDVCLCVFDHQTGKKPPLLRYAGAKRPLYLVRDGQLIEIAADRKSIGGRQTEQERKFNTHQLALLNGDQLYLTSDGFADQNNQENQKYGLLRFKDKLVQLAQYAMEEQQALLAKELDTFSQGKNQRDDITIFGLKV